MVFRRSEPLYRCCAQTGVGANVAANTALGTPKKANPYVNLPGSVMPLEPAFGAGVAGGASDEAGGEVDTTYADLLKNQSVVNSEPDAPTPGQHRPTPFSPLRRQNVVWVHFCVLEGPGHGLHVKMILRPPHNTNKSHATVFVYFAQPAPAPAMMMKWTLAAEETKGVFEALKQKPTNKSELPAECVNLKQNRHFDVLPNPTTRVMLTQTAGGVASTYYNANYMPAEDGAAKRYICAQGPMADTVADFWRMVVEHGVRSVVMATGVEENGRSKCARYWPEPSCSQTYGGWTVVSGEVSQGPGFKTTKLTVTHASLTARGPHDVTHFWFDTWKDHSTPKTASIVSYRVVQKTG